MNLTQQHPGDARRRGWCPGALRPMQSGDGLLVRIKPSCATLSLDQAEAIATLAHRHGNGLVELTSRANVQLRGIRAAALDDLTAGLDSLGSLDATPQAEARRNVIAAPLAGLDASAFDTRGVVRALERALAASADLGDLSDKFGFAVDGGGLLTLADVEADVRFCWTGTAFAVGLARDQGCDWIGTCAPDDVPVKALALTRAFLALAAGHRRMRHADTDVRARIASAPDVHLHPIAPASFAKLDAAPLSPCDPLVALELLPIAAIALPYGGTTSTALYDLLQRARACGAAELRLTPWRALLIPLPVRGAVATLRHEANRLGFITDPRDPRRAIAACPGAPACASASTPVRVDADRFAAAAATLLGDGVTLHVSGCSKGCARRRAATLTLVADAGRYGLVVNAMATAAPPARYTAAQAAETLARLASAVTKAGDTSAAGRAAALSAALKEIEAG